MGVGEFVGTNSTNDVTDALGAKVGETMVVDVGFDGAVKRTRHMTFVKSESDRNNKIATLLGGVEYGMAVREIEVVMI